MTVTRRHLLKGAAAFTAAAAAAAAAAAVRFTPSHDAESIASIGVVARGRDVLLLHDGSATASAFACELRASTPSRVSDTAVTVLTLRGFREVGALLDASRGKALLALLDDGDGVVMEALLKVRGAGNLVRRRQGNQALLSVVL